MKNNQTFSLTFKGQSYSCATERFCNLKKLSCIIILKKSATYKVDIGEEDSKLHIREFQNMMKHIYFQRDFERETVGTFNWFVEEVEELKEAIEEGKKKAIESEFADVFAWLASLANVVNVDLERAAMSKYDNRCPKCRLNPCECP